MSENGDIKKYFGSFNKIAWVVGFIVISFVLPLLIGIIKEEKIIIDELTIILWILLNTISLLTHIARIDKVHVDQQLEKIEKSVNLRVNYREIGDNLQKCVDVINNKIYYTNIMKNTPLIQDSLTDIERIVNGETFYFDDETYIKQLQREDVVGFCGISTAKISVWRETQLIYYLLMHASFSAKVKDYINSIEIDNFTMMQWKEYCNKNFENLTKFNEQTDLRKFSYRFIVADKADIVEGGVLKNRYFDPLIGIHYMSFSPFCILDVNSLRRVEIPFEEREKKIIDNILKEEKLPDFFLIKNHTQYSIWGKNPNDANSVIEYTGELREKHEIFLKYLIHIKCKYPTFEIEPNVRQVYRYPVQ